MKLVEEEKKMKNETTKESKRNQATALILVRETVQEKPHSSSPLLISEVIRAPRVMRRPQAVFLSLEPCAFDAIERDGE